MTYTAADLELAERHVEEGERHVHRQRALIAELARDGHPVTSALELLAEFERMLEQQSIERPLLSR